MEIYPIRSWHFDDFRTYYKMLLWFRGIFIIEKDSAIDFQFNALITVLMTEIIL